MWVPLAYFIMFIVVDTKLVVGMLQMNVNQKTRTIALLVYARNWKIKTEEKLCRLENEEGRR